MSPSSTQKATQRKPRAPAVTVADLCMAVIFVIIVLGLVAMAQIYSSIESINQLRQLNFQQIITWRDIGQRIEFLVSTRENRLESDLLLNDIKVDVAGLIANTEVQEEKIKRSLRGLNRFWILSGLQDAELQEVETLDVDPELKVRAREVRDAPLSLLRSNFDHWPISTTIRVESGQFIAPLYKREKIISKMKERRIDRLYLQGALVIGATTAGILVIWFVFLRPTVRKLSVARADTQFILDNAPGYICSYSPDGNFVSANQSYIDLVGAKSVEKMKARHVSEIVGPDRWSDIKSHMKRAQEGAFVNFDTEVDVGGEGRTMHVSYRPKYTENGSVSAVVAMMMDITDRHRAERALRLSEENLRITLDSIFDAVIATDMHGAIIRLNPQASALTGWTENTALGQELNEVFQIVGTQEEQSISLDPFTQILEQAGTLSKDIQLVSKNGTEYRIASSGAPIRNPEGDAVGVVVVFRDTTEEFLLNQRLTQSEKLKSIGQLAGGIAHDFNNLLAGIQGAVDLISLRWPKKQTDKNIDDLTSQVERLVRRGAGLTEKLTMFARVKEPQLKPVDVRGLVDDCVAMVKSTSDRRITFKHSDNAENTSVVGNESALQTGVLNVMLNSVDAIGDAGTISVSLSNTSKQGDGDSQQQDYLEIVISDTGVGIKDEDVRRIFDPFFTTKELGEGTGLGLSTTYATVQDMGGEIIVESQPGEGTEFKILLPSFAGSAVKRNTNSSKAVMQPIQISRTVLLADDEEAIRSAIREYLEDLNFKVIEAKDGQSCISTFQENIHDIDAVVLDVNMPKKSGVEVLDAICTDDNKCPVFLSTGYSSEDNNVYADDDRVTEILEKPYRLEKLARSLAKAIDTQGRLRS